MWTTIFPVLLLGLAINAVLEVIPIELPIDRRILQDFIALGANGNNSLYTKTKLNSDGDVSYQTLSSNDPESDANIFQKNRSSDGGIHWDKVAHFLNSGSGYTLQAENVAEAIKTTNSSDACKRGLERYFDSLSRWETWAVKMADASGKIGGGVLDGTVMFLGSFDECLKIRVESLVDEEEDFRGQYCLVMYGSPLLHNIFLKNGSLNTRYLETFGQPPEWIEDFIVRSGPYLKIMYLTLGTCVPSICSAEDIKNILMQITAPLDLNIFVTGCQVDKPMKWTTSFISAVSVLSALAVLCTLGTVIDIAKRFTSRLEKPVESKSSFVRLLKMFSVLSNTEMLLSRKISGNLACLDGIRFLSIAWIVLSHSYDILETLSFMKYSNFLKIDDEFNGFLPNAVLDNAATVLGTFFFLRLTPALALTIAVFVVLGHLGSGPIWSTTLDPVMEGCTTGCWKNFLYINNWFSADSTCLMHTWYLGVLMQLHIVGFLLIHLIIRWRVLGVFVGLVLCFGCTALVAWIVIWKRLPLPAEFALQDQDIQGVITEWLRFRPYYYIPSYVIGILVGYLVVKYKDKKIEPRYQVLAWILSIACGLYAVYGIYGPGNSLEVVVFFYTFHFIAWSAGLGWVIYACIAGYGGILNRFLSWSAFSLLSTLGYLVYLLHYVVTNYTTAALRGPINYGHYELVCLFLSNLVISYLLAFVCHVAVAMPFAHLERIIF